MTKIKKKITDPIYSYSLSRKNTKRRRKEGGRGRKWRDREKRKGRGEGRRERKERIKFRYIRVKLLRTNKQRTFLEAFRRRKKAYQDEKEDNYSRLHIKDYATQKTMEWDLWKCWKKQKNSESYSHTKVTSKMNIK